MSDCRTVRKYFRTFDIKSAEDVEEKKNEETVEQCLYYKTNHNPT